MVGSPRSHRPRSGSLPWRSAGLSGWAFARLAAPLKRAKRKSDARETLRRDSETPRTTTCRRRPRCGPTGRALRCRIDLQASPLHLEGHPQHQGEGEAQPEVQLEIGQEYRQGHTQQQHHREHEPKVGVDRPGQIRFLDLKLDSHALGRAYRSPKLGHRQEMRSLSGRGLRVAVSRRKNADSTSSC